MSEAEDEEVLFKVTRSHLDMGMRGIPVGTCRTSAVSPVEGVSYVGYPVAELADMDPVELMWLLRNKELPTSAETRGLWDELKARAEVPDQIWDALERLPTTGHPMDWMAIGIQLCGMVLKQEDWEEDGLRLIAVMPHLMAGIFRLHEGRGRPGPPPGVGYVEDFVALLDRDDIDDAVPTAYLRVFVNLHMDHGGGNLSTFVGKAVASGHADLFASMASAMNALSGPLHGRANQACLEFVRRVGSDDPAEIERFVRAELDSRRPIYGFGHAVLRAEDPRARVQLEVGQKLGIDTLEFRTALAMRSVVPPILKENPRISNPYPNVDLASGSMLDAVGFHDPNFFTTFFGWARVAGISAQLLDERVHTRGGKGVPIYRPKYFGVEQPRRHVDD